MKPIFLAAICTVIAGQAHALSCTRPDPFRTFSELAAAEEDYFVLYGTLTFDEKALPSGFRDVPGADPDPIPAQFTGKGLTRDGFTSDYISPAVLQVGCVANYCGGASSGAPALYFVRADNMPVQMQASPCGGRIFEAPSQAVLDQLTACMQGADCSAQTFE